MTAKCCEDCYGSVWGEDALCAECLQDREPPVYLRLGLDRHGKPDFGLAWGERDVDGRCIILQEGQ